MDGWMDLLIISAGVADKKKGELFLQSHFHKLHRSDHSSGLEDHQPYRQVRSSMVLRVNGK